MKIAKLALNVSFNKSVVKKWRINVTSDFKNMESYNLKEAFVERAAYLRSLVNSLVIQNLACGNIPKVKPGIPMHVESLQKLKEELDSEIAESLKHDIKKTTRKKKAPRD